MECDAGNAGEVWQVVSDAIARGTTFPIILDQPRTLRVVHTSHSSAEIKIMARDEDSSEFIRLFIPLDDTQRARADVPNSLSA